MIRRRIAAIAWVIVLSPLIALAFLGAGIAELYLTVLEWWRRPRAE